jgi:hypothetical protein
VEAIDFEIATLSRSELRLAPLSILTTDTGIESYFTCWAGAWRQAPCHRYASFPAQVDGKAVLKDQPAYLDD